MIIKTINNYYFEIQYFIHKYFWFIVFAQILLFFLPFVMIRLKKKIKKNSPFVIFLTSLLLFFIFYKDKIFSMQGWDRKSVCNWIDISKSHQNLNLYSVQFSSNSNLIDVETPFFSLYYHPILIKKIELFCNINFSTYNLIVICFLTIAAIFLSSNFKNINNFTIFTLIFFSLNNLVWLINTGQFFFLELFALIAALTFLDKGKIKLSIFFFFIFGIQKIYFFIFSIYIAFKYFKFKGIASLAALFGFLNLIVYELLPDYLYFWFSDEGYLNGNRGSKHSFLYENFGEYNQSIFSLIRGLLDYFKFEVNQIILLFIIFFASIYFIYLLVNKTNIKYISPSEDYIIFTLLILLFPLLKPYVYLYFIVIILYFLNRMYSSDLEYFTLYILTIPSFIYLTIRDYLYKQHFPTGEVISNLLNLQYEFVMSYSFFSTWILIYFIYKTLIKLKGNN